MKTIEQFTNAVRDQFPELIRQASGGEVEQVEDRGLMAWTDGGEDAFEIDLSNGARYQITVRQVAAASEECDGCGTEVHPDEMTEDGTGRLLCITCFGEVLDAYENSQPVPSESPYDGAGRVTR